jgi:hypothetical protein
METDLTSIVIAIIASLTFIGPIVYFEYFKKRATLKFAAYFKKVSRNNSLNLSKYDVWNDQYGIGIDADAKKMIYLHKRNGHDVTELHNLPEVRNCRTIKEDNLIKTPDGDRRFPIRVEMHIEFVNPEKKNVSIEFYKGEITDFVRDEYLLAEKWSKIINSGIKKDRARLGA